jgi:hypothetical protein
VHAWRALTCQASNRLAPAPDPHRRGQGRQPACEGRSNHGLSDRRSRCAQPPPAPRARQDQVAGEDAPLPSGASNQGRGEPRAIPGQLRLSPCGGSARTLAQRTPAVRGKHRLIVLARNVHPDEPQPHASSPASKRDGPHTETDACADTLPGLRGTRGVSRGGGGLCPAGSPGQIGRAGGVPMSCDPCRATVAVVAVAPVFIVALAALIYIVPRGGQGAARAPVPSWSGTYSSSAPSNMRTTSCAGMSGTPKPTAGRARLAGQ